VRRLSSDPSLAADPSVRGSLRSHVVSIAAKARATEPPVDTTYQRFSTAKVNAI
jgi:hypothetical protein